MLQKTSGRGGWLTTAEAARLLGVTSDHVHHMTRGRLLDAHYPEGRRAGKRFREEDVLALKDLRREGRTKVHLERMALRAVLASRRAERRVEELTHYLGLDAPGLPLEPESIAATHSRIDEWLLHKELEGQAEALDLARLLLGVSEEYLELVARHTGSPHPWAHYFELGAALARKLPPDDPARPYVEHARRSVRNAAYFYLRAARGMKAADATFPGERYSDLLLRMRPKN